MKYEIVSGLETHVELSTKTKIFCGCTTAFGGAPNSHTCPVCTGMPGALPILNRKVLEYAIRAGLATNCKINLINNGTKFEKYDTITVSNKLKVFNRLKSYKKKQVKTCFFSNYFLATPVLWAAS